MYHDCDDAEGAIICQELIQCRIPVDQLHHADLFAAGFVVHATVTLNWEPCEFYGKLYIRIMSIIIPYGSYLLYGNWTAYLYFMICVSAVDIIMRIIFKCDPSELEHPVYNPSDETCFDILEQRVEPMQSLIPLSSTVYGWLLLIPLAIFCVCMCIFLQYTSMLDGRYAFRHMLWHCVGSAAGLFATLAFARYIPEEQQQQRTFDSKTYLYVQQQQIKIN
jgi:hypothetical protein